MIIYISYLYIYNIQSYSIYSVHPSHRGYRQVLTDKWQKGRRAAVEAAEPYQQATAVALEKALGKMANLAVFCLFFC